MYDPLSDNPYAPENLPKITEGALTYVWRTNAERDQLVSKDNSDALTYFPRGGGTPLELAHARLGRPHSTGTLSTPALEARGFVGVYELK